MFQQTGPETQVNFKAALSLSEGGEGREGVC